MSITFENLSNKELELYEHVCELRGSIEEKHTKLIIDGTYEKYREVHRNYFNLFLSTKNDVEKLEILKRLTFLNWYSFTEPSFFTGIEDLDKSIIFKSYSILDDYLTTHKIDRELRFMLSYYSSFEWAILEFSEGELHELTRFVKKSFDIPFETLSHKIIMEEMQNRGMMGIYWSSMIREN
ncbi:MAG: hypothetical protein EOO47_13570 [Flavobacterium sp.]|nr:MAG: hypothetical protein EOO47_13570 [Flavobacterium sp.]